MKYQRFSDALFLRIDPDEEICSQLICLAKQENIPLAEISGLGAVKELTIGVFDTVQKRYHSNHFSGVFEITSLTGTLTQKDGSPYLHLHMSVGDKDGHVYGGHLNQAVVSATAELVIRQIPGSVGRKMDEGIGLNLFHF